MDSVAVFLVQGHPVHPRESIVNSAPVVSLAHFGVFVLAALERGLVAVPPVRLEQVCSMAVDLAVALLVVVDAAVLVLVSVQLAHAGQSVVDPAPVVLV